MILVLFPKKWHLKFTKFHSFQQIYFISTIDWQQFRIKVIIAVGILRRRPQRRWSSETNSPSIIRIVNSKWIRKTSCEIVTTWADGQKNLPSRMAIPQFSSLSRSFECSRYDVRCGSLLVAVNTSNLDCLKLIQCVFASKNCPKHEKLRTCFKNTVVTWPVWITLTTHGKGAIGWSNKALND